MKFCVSTVHLWILGSKDLGWIVYHLKISTKLSKKFLGPWDPGTRYFSPSGNRLELSVEVKAHFGHFIETKKEPKTDNNSSFFNLFRKTLFCSPVSEV